MGSILKSPCVSNQCGISRTMCCPHPRLSAQQHSSSDLLRCGACAVGDMVQALRCLQPAAATGEAKVSPQRAHHHSVASKLHNPVAVFEQCPAALFVGWRCDLHHNCMPTLHLTAERPDQHSACCTIRAKPHWCTVLSAPCSSSS